RAQVHVRPAGEPVLQVPGALSVADQRQPVPRLARPIIAHRRHPRAISRPPAAPPSYHRRPFDGRQRPAPGATGIWDKVAGRVENRIVLARPAVVQSSPHTTENGKAPRSGNSSGPGPEYHGTYHIVFLPYLRQWIHVNPFILGRSEKAGARGRRPSRR